MSHRGGGTERKDGKVGKMREWRSSRGWVGGVEWDGKREGGGNYCTACFLS